MTRTFLTTVFISIFISANAQLKLTTPNVESILYLGTGNNQPLIVGLGGSEGGNAWSSDHWKETRDYFVNNGYAFLAIGYFGAEGTPEILNKIAIEDVHNAILTAKKEKQINKNKTAIIGGSRGGDLALILGSYFSDINCIVAIVPSHVVFPGHTQEFNSSCWTYQNKELPFVPVNEQAVPFLIKRDLRGAFDAMLQDHAAEQNALIKVENINGPILLLSATKDEICPSTPMCLKMVETLKIKHYKFKYEHLAFEGSHSEPLKHFGEIYKFLDTNFKNNQ